MKNTISPFIFLYIIALCAFTSCNRTDDILNVRQDWNGDPVYSIALKNREQKFNRGNLIVNPGFEKGKYYKVDTAHTIFDLQGWNKIGDNVYWVSIDSGFKPMEVSSGIHSIKIVRQVANETADEGEGIVSDFIKVIPGHYRLKLDLRLENVESPSMRMGTNLYDAVNIRLHFFDKNKVEINPGWKSDYYNRLIDNSFKAINIAQFPSIDSTGWQTLLARSSWEPTWGSNIPLEAAFVKLSVTFKGTGTIWVDNAGLYYTEENFLLSERMEKFLKQEINPVDLILPTPKKVVEKNRVDYAPKDSGIQFIFAVYGDEKHKTLYKNAETDLTQYLSKVSNNYKKNNESNILVKNNAQGMLQQNGNKLQFIFGLQPNDETLLRRYTDAYTIRYEQDSHTAFINSASEKGFRYATSTLKQLFDTISYSFYAAEVVDWPDAVNRSIVLLDTGAIFGKEFFKLYKPACIFNGAQAKNDHDCCVFKKMHFDSLSLISCNKNCQYLLDYSHHPLKDLPEISDNINIKDEDLLAILPISTNNSLVSHDLQVLKPNGNGFKAAFSGNTAYPLEIDMFDLLFYKRYFSSFFFYDKRYSHTKMQPGGFIKPYNLFTTEETFNKLVMENAVIQVDNKNILDVMGGVTFLDYMWNREAYDATESLYKLMVKFLSKKQIRELLVINENFHELSELSKKPETIKNIKFIEAVNQKLESNIKTFIKKYPPKNAFELHIINQISNLKY